MSSINPNNIDGSYPIAGQDNDSQGFRDNFTNIKNNFTFAAAELKDLQDNAILKTALAGTTLDNNLNYAILKGAQLIKTVETKNDLGSSLSGTVPVDWSTGHFQTITSTGGSITLTFSNWPTSQFWTSFTLEINVSNIAHTLTLPSAVSINSSSIQGSNGASPATITFPTAGKYLLEFSTYDGGATITVRDLTRNYTKPDYQIYKPTANVSIQANVNVNRVIIAPTPAGSITSFWTDVILPNAAVDGKTISISSNVKIETFRVLSPWVGYTVDTGANVTLANNTSATYMFHSADNKWFKV